MHKKDVIGHVGVGADTAAAALLAALKKAGVDISGPDISQRVIREEFTLSMPRRETHVVYERKQRQDDMRQRKSGAAQIKRQAKKARRKR